MDEFSLIKSIFKRPELTEAGGYIDKGIGDDCAIITPPADSQLVQSIDTLVDGVHFPTHSDPFLIGYRSLAVSVSDLAAMGVTPHSFFLAISLPKACTKWLTKFGFGISTAAKKTKISLAGGDTTKGPLSITIHVQGFIQHGKALLRNGAKPGDYIYVSGTLGDAKAALPYVLGQKVARSQHERYLVDRYWMPTPRVSLGLWLRTIGASSTIDISDGFTGDLNHILEESCCGAEINTNKIPLSNAIKQVCGDKALLNALQGGDEYELCFSVPSNVTFSSEITFTDHSSLTNLADNTYLLEFADGSSTYISRIGIITDEYGKIRLDGRVYKPSGYRHF